jgi:hypothetical protein
VPTNAVLVVFIERVHECPRRADLSRVLALIGSVLPFRGRKGYQGQSPWLAAIRCR